jgi:hypothetical protein
VALIEWIRITNQIKLRILTQNSKLVVGKVTSSNPKVLRIWTVVVRLSAQNCKRYPRAVLVLWIWTVVVRLSV